MVAPGEHLEPEPIRALARHPSSLPPGACGAGASGSGCVMCRGIAATPSLLASAERRAAAEASDPGLRPDRIRLVLPCGAWWSYATHAGSTSRRTATDLIRWSYPASALPAILHPTRISDPARSVRVGSAAQDTAKLVTTPVWKDTRGVRGADSRVRRILRRSTWADDRQLPLRATAETILQVISTYKDLIFNWLGSFRDVAESLPRSNTRWC